MLVAGVAACSGGTRRARPSAQGFCCLGPPPRRVMPLRVHRRLAPDGVRRSRCPYSRRSIALVDSPSSFSRCCADREEEEPAVPPPLQARQAAPRCSWRRPRQPRVAGASPRSASAGPAQSSSSLRMLRQHPVEASPLLRCRRSSSRERRRLGSGRRIASGTSSIWHREYSPSASPRRRTTAPAPPLGRGRRRRRRRRRRHREGAPRHDGRTSHLDG